MLHLQHIYISHYVSHISPYVLELWRRLTTVLAHIPHFWVRGNTHVGEGKPRFNLFLASVGKLQTFQMYQKESNTKISLNFSIAKAKSFNVECLSCLVRNDWFLCTKPSMNVGSPAGVYPLSIITGLFIAFPCSSIEISSKVMFMPQSFISTVLRYSSEQIPSSAFVL